MKRLIAKKDNGRDPIVRWLQSESPSNSEIDAIYSSSEIYSGDCYRFKLVDYDVSSLFNGDDFMEGNMDEISKDEILKQFESLVRINDSYKSFSKDISSCKTFAENNYPNEFGFIIKSNVSGIDVNKYIYDNDLEDYENISDYLYEEEVIAKFDDFEIVELFNTPVQNFPAKMTYDDLYYAINDNRL